MPAAIWEDFERRFNVQIVEFYGAAEGGLTRQSRWASLDRPASARRVPTLKYRHRGRSS